MCKRKGLWLCIVATLMLTTVAIAQDKDRNLDGKQLDRDQMQRAVQDRMEMFVGQVTDPLVEQVSKSIVQRYGLDQTAVSKIRQSIQESAEALLKQPKGMLALTTAAREGNYTKMLETLLSHPNCKAAFTKYLSEGQLQDYIDFSHVREQRDRQVVARHLTAWLDRQLSLTVDQREKIEQRLIANADKGWLVDARDILWNRLRPEAVIRRRFKHPPDDVLSQTQLVIWEQLVVLPKFNIRGQIPEHAQEIVARVQADIMEDLKAGRIDRGEVELTLEFRDRDEVEVMKIELWDEDKDDTSESQEEKRRVAAAKLDAHTQQLGPLDENASQRLTLATKGVVEEYLEAQDDDWETKYEEAGKEIREAVVAGKMTRLEVAQRLEDLKRRLRAEERATNSDIDITRYPLYQRTIEDVLSEEAFAQYKSLQTDRQIFHQQALRDLLVASIDTTLFLSDEQRKYFEMAAAELSISPTTDKASAPVYLVYQLFQRTDRELLSPWQREEFERIYRELEREIRFAEKK